MIRFDTRLVTLLAGASVFAAVACSSPPPPPNDLADGEDTSGGNEQKSTKKPPKNNNNNKTPPESQNEGTPPKGDTTTPPPGTKNCGGETSAQACFACCSAGNEQPLNDAWKVFDACVCQTPGTCKAACGTSYCAGQQPSQACIQCLDGAKQCEQQGDAACAANPGCKAIQDCTTLSKCDDKP